MAIISTKTITETYCVRDIKRSFANAFCTSGSDFYFGYIDWNDHAVVWTSTDDGVHWRKVWDFGVRDGITVTTSLDGDIIATYWDSQIRVARNGSEISLGSTGRILDSITLHAVCYYPLLIVAGWLTVRIDRYPSWGVDIVNSWFIYNALGWTGSGVLGYSSDGQHVCCINGVNAYFLPMNNKADPIIGWTGYMSYYSTGNIADTLPIALENGPYTDRGGTAYSGWRSFPNFEGVGTGFEVWYISSAGQLSDTGMYTPGLTSQGARIGPAQRADRGLRAPHDASFCARVDGHLTFAFVDKNGLIGSTMASNDLDFTDSNGVVAPYGRARNYGTLPGLPTTFMFGQAKQSGGRFTFFVLTAQGTAVRNSQYDQTAAESSAAMSLVRISDTAVHQKRRSSNIMLRSAVAVSTPITTKTTTGNALGVIRQHAKGTAFNLTTLLDALTDSGRSVLPNPNKSHGCSPVLRALLTQAGLPFSVTRELFNDADPRSHKGGNALDVAAPTPDGMATICAFLASVPTLFATVVYTTPTQSLYIWDGKIASVKQFGGATAQIVTDSTQAIHISSSTTRLVKALHSSAVRVTLGIAPPITDTGTPTGRKALDPFTADQYVYVGNAINVDDDDIAPSAHIDTDHGSDFW